MSAADPFELIRELRADAPQPSAEARARARAESIGQGTPDSGMPQRPSRRSNRRRIALVATAVVLACLIAVGLTSLPGGSSQDAEAAALARLVNVAGNQQRLNAKGRNLYMLSRFTTDSTSTLAITQAKLDRFKENQVTMIDARNETPPGMYVSSRSKKTPAQQRRSEYLLAKLQKRIDDGVRKGVKASELGVSSVTVHTMLPVVSWQNDRGLGATGGQKGGRTTYGSPAEKRAAAILLRAQLSGPGANPIDFGGFEYATQPAAFALKAAQVKSLSDDPKTLRSQLIQNPSRRAIQDDEDAPSSPRALFKATTSLLSSPYAEPGVRAAALKVAAELPGVAIDSDAKDSRGRAGLGLTLGIRGGTQQVVFDQGDSRVLGMNIVITDPTKFQGRVTYAGAPRGFRVMPRYDTGSIQVSYDPTIVTRGEPVCHASFCEKAIHEIPNP